MLLMQILMSNYCRCWTLISRCI